MTTTTVDVDELRTDLARLRDLLARIDRDAEALRPYLDKAIADEDTERIAHVFAKRHALVDERADIADRLDALEQTIREAARLADPHEARGPRLQRLPDGSFAAVLH